MNIKQKAINALKAKYVYPYAVAMRLAGWRQGKWPTTKRQQFWDTVARELQTY